MKSYKVIQSGNEYTIGEWDDGYQAFIVNDGICGYYWWSTAEAAQKAADAYNSYEGPEYLGQHGYGNDLITNTDDVSQEMYKLYELFNAVRISSESLYE
jgi:hypothetical protein